MKNISKLSPGYASCLLMAEASIKKADEPGFKIAITFANESGLLKTFFRTDHARLVTINALRNKAITTVGFGIPCGDSWYKFIEDDPILFNGIRQFNGFILPGGGSPVIEDNSVIGAIGISGGHY